MYMESTISVLDNVSIALKSTYLGDKSKVWSVGGKPNPHNHEVVVEYGGNSITFDFWGSIMNPDISNEQELVFAFYCFLSDAVSGYNSLDEFGQLLGEGLFVSQVQNMYNACVEAKDKAETLFNGIDLYELLDDIQEKYEC